MNDAELKQRWRKRAVTAYDHFPRAFKARFFDKFDVRFATALVAAGLTLDQLKQAEIDISSPEWKPEAQQAFYLMWESFGDQMGIPPRERQPREYRGGSGTTNADGSHNDVVKVKQPNRGRWPKQ